MAYTFKPTPQGTVEIFQNGQRISTGSVNYARSLGYQAETPTSLAGITIPPITPESITPVTPFQPVTPQILPPTDISGLAEPLTLTPKEQEESAVNKRLQQINEQLTGKTTFEAEKRTEFGVSAAQQAFDDLNRQMRDLQRQQQLVPLTIQQESIGRGRTEAGIEPLEIGRRRALAYDALAVASFIDAAQGRLASAERKVNEAIEQKFGPLEAQQRALMANLNLIRESPEASIQDKNRAAKQLAIEEARQKQNEEDKAKAKRILDIADQTAAEMARRGTLNAVVLNQIKDAPDDVSALMIAAPYLEESRLAGTGAELQTFAALHPELKIGTEEFRVAWDKFQAEKPPTGLGDFEQAFLRDKGRLPTVQELLEFKKQSGGAGRVPEVTDLASDEAIDAWARRINSGTDKISSVPHNLRNKVVARAKDFAEEDLIEDISLGFGKNLTSEALITQLETAYPEFTKSEITNKVNELKPQTTTEKPQGFFGKIGSFFGSLFR